MIKIKKITPRNIIYLMIKNKKKSKTKQKIRVTKKKMKLTKKSRRIFTLMKINQKNLILNKLMKMKPLLKMNQSKDKNMLKMKVKTLKNLKIWKNRLETQMMAQIQLVKNNYLKISIKLNSVKKHQRIKTLKNN